MFYANLTSGVDNTLYSQFPLFNTENIADAIKSIGDLNKNLLIRFPETKMFYKLYQKD